MMLLGKETILTVPDACRWLKDQGVEVTEKTLYRWMSVGKLDREQLGGKVFTSVEALQRMAARRQGQEGKQARKRRKMADDSWADDELVRLGVL